MILFNVVASAFSKESAHLRASASALSNEVLMHLDPPTLSQPVLLLIGVAIAVALASLCGFSVVFLSTFGMERAAGKMLQNINKEELGVEVTVEKWSVNHLFGRLELHGVEVKNPTGYHSPNVLRIERATLIVDCIRYALSGGNALQVDRISLDDVQVIYERRFRHSNVQESLLAIGRLPPLSPASAKQEAQRALTLREVQFYDVTVRAALSDASQERRLEVQGLGYHNFSEQVGQLSVDETFRMLLQSLLKTALAHLPGAVELQAEGCLPDPCFGGILAGSPKNRRTAPVSPAAAAAQPSGGFGTELAAEGEQQQVPPAVDAPASADSKKW